MAPVAAKNNTKKGNTDISAKDKLHQVQQQKPGISYILYLHREELRMCKPNLMRKACTKLELTHELITKAIQNADKCSPDDLHNISRQTIFKNKLRRKIAHAKHYLAVKYQKNLKRQLKQHSSIQEQHRQPLPVQQDETHPLPPQQNQNEANKSAKVDKIRRKLF